MIYSLIYRRKQGDIFPLTVATLFFLGNALDSRDCIILISIREVRKTMKDIGECAD
jgi:hypothetical protein